MSIIAYTGLPGHGKSYSVVENVVIPALKQGRVVAHNLELVLSALNVVCERDVSKLLVQIPKQLTPDELIELVPAGAVVILDEVWQYWPAGVKSNEVPQHQMAFFKEHRHRVGPDGLASEIVIIDQELGSGVARFIRDLVELTYIHTKHSAVGLTKSFRVDIYTRAQNATKPSRAAHLRSMQGRYKPEVWNCYVSHTQSESKLGEAGLEKMPDSRGSLLKSWGVRVGIAGAVLLPLLLWNAGRSFKSMGPEPAQRSERSERASRESVPAAQPAPPPPPVTPARPSESNRWTLRGFVEVDGVSKAILEAMSGVRYIPREWCQYQDADWVCKVEGELVTAWTGNVWQKYFQAESYAPGGGG